MILLAAPAMIYIFLLSTKRLYGSLGHKVNFDQFVLTIESVKLSIYLVFSFFILHQSMMIYVQILQTSIQFFICLSFIMKVFNIAGLKRLQNVTVGAFATAFSGVVFACVIMT
jgi:hypothetical protein